MRLTQSQSPPSKDLIGPAIINILDNKVGFVRSVIPARINKPIPQGVQPVQPPDPLRLTVL
jgi:hypothetical protein